MESTLKLDLLVMTVHPDDAELGAGGVIAKYVAAGKKVGIIDLTRGELGSRGTAETRANEAKDAAEILGVHVRENLGLADGFFQNEKSSQLAIIKALRKYKPEIVITNAIEDRHPDHGRANKLVYDSVFLAGLQKIETSNDSGQSQEQHRPRLLLEVIQDRFIQPDIVIDITPFWNIKKQSILAYQTQFNSTDPKDGPATYISNPTFMKATEARALELGRNIQVDYAEGFTSRKILGVSDLFELI